ncbi:hypothetical protein ABZX77_14890 [Streptomyces sp. NPDC004237]|uniref:hypothetical protein n=1 Tax=Streptomyces sp. NPDC004237 TaxID=3154455 RepID=UPI0033A72C2F
MPQPVYVMRRATTADLKPIADLLEARRLWLLNRGRRSYGQGNALLGLLAQPDETSMVIGLFTATDNQLRGCSMLFPTAAAAPGWTASERRERAWILTMSHTHPDVRGDRIGWLMTMWASDYAARQPDPPTWMRCRVPHPALIAHHRDQLGWQLVRSVRDPDLGEIALMQRRPESSPGLSAVITSRIPVEVL